MHMPPPVHGASMMGKYIHDSKLIDQTFDCRYINLTLAKDLSDIGKGGFSKLWNFLKQMNHIASTIHMEKPTMLRNPQYQRRCFLQRFYSGDVTQSYGTKRNCALS